MNWWREKFKHIQWNIETDGWMSVRQRHERERERERRRRGRGSKDKNM